MINTPICKKKYILQITFAYALFILLALPLYSSNALPLRFRTVNINNGLSHNMINAIYKDQRGFVWLGTQLGLDRYDGINVTNYPQLQGYSVFAICETDSIFLWIGTDKGLIRMNRRTEETEIIHLENKQSHVRSLYPLTPDTLLVGNQFGLFILTGDKNEKILFDPNPLSLTNYITKILPSYEKGVFWITTQKGLVRFQVKDKKVDVFKREPDDNSSNTFLSLAQIDDVLYIGSRSQGIVKFDIRTNQFINFPYSGNSYIMTLAVADSSAIYAGTNGGGFVKVDAQTGEILSAIEHANDEKGISSNAVYSFLQDEDIFWIGTYMGGLNYNPTHGDLFSVYNFQDKFNSGNYNIRSFYIDENGDKLIGTRDGFIYISQEKNIVKRFTTKTSLLESDIILSVTKYDDHYIIGTYGGGLYRFNPENLSLSWFMDKENFQNDSFSAYITDEDGNLWIASSHGVYVYNPKTKDYQIYNSSNSGLSTNSVFSIMKDSRGQIWFGTTSTIYMYDPQSKLFRSSMFPAHILPYLKSVRYIYEDRQGNLWFCDDKEGVVKVDKDFSVFTHYTTDDFLPSNSVTSITEDDRGGMWFASQRGLVYMNPETNQTNFYSLFDGIPGYIFNTCVQITADGTIWWGNEQGLVYYNPAKSTRKERKKYYPAITSVSIAGKVHHAGDENMPFSSAYTSGIEISSENSIEFTFSALNYSVENTDIYEYQLEGYDTGWNVLMSGNKAFYENLPPGKYTFRLKSSSNPDLVTSVSLKVKRNIPTAVWVGLITLASCLVLIYSYTRLLSKYRRMKEAQQRKEQEQQREKYARSRIEETTASDISRKLVDYMQQDKPFLNPDLKLQDVAKAVGCSSVELSQVLNIHLNTNYTDFMNQYRVEEFIARVQDKSASKFTLATLSEQSGFSSRTSFFRSFKKLKGKTPAEYIRDMGIELRK